MALRDHPGCHSLRSPRRRVGRRGRQAPETARAAGNRHLAADKLVTQARQGAAWTLTDKGKEAIAAKGGNGASQALDGCRCRHNPQAAATASATATAHADTDRDRRRDAAFLALNRRRRCDETRAGRSGEIAGAPKPRPRPQGGTRCVPAKPAKRKAAAKPKDAAKIEANVAADGILRQAQEGRQAEAGQGQKGRQNRGQPMTLKEKNRPIVPYQDHFITQSKIRPRPPVSSGHGSNDTARYDSQETRGIPPLRRIRCRIDARYEGGF